MQTTRPNLSLNLDTSPGGAARRPLGSLGDNKSMGILTMFRKVSMAVLAALVGFTAGTVTSGVLGTLKLVLDPGVQYSSFKASLILPALTFMAALYWSALGGALFVLPQAVLLLMAYAIAFREGWRERRYLRDFTLGFAIALWIPVFYFGFWNRFLDAALVAMSMVVAVRASLGFLNRRLHIGPGE